MFLLFIDIFFQDGIDKPQNAKTYAITQRTSSKVTF
jgi:hypothetical protein